MNQAVRPIPRPSATPPLVTGRDREFLPAAIEILESPPSPVATLSMMVLCAFVVVALTWAYFGRLEVYAVAQGKIEMADGAQVIQPLEPGKVLTVAVENGQHVRAGDLLVEFDPTDAAADEKDLSDQVIALKAEITRRSAGIKTAGQLSKNARFEAKIVWSEVVPAAVREREDAVLVADLDQLVANVDDIARQIDQRNATIDRLAASIGFEQQLITTLKSRVQMRETLVKQEAGPRTNLIDAQETLERAQSALASDVGQVTETHAAIGELAGAKSKAVSQFIADYQSKRADAQRKAEDIEQQFAKARAKLGRTQLYSPIDGTIQQLALTTKGQVATTGQQLMIVVPSSGPLQIKIYMNNNDIGFVKAGQSVAIKVDAFPFTRYGVLHGHVIKIATDAVDEEDARREQANVTSLANAANSYIPPGQSQNFLFPVTLSLDEHSISIGDRVMPVLPGMTVTAEVKTESRRVIDYLFSPLARVASEAMREQ